MDDKALDRIEAFLNGTMNEEERGQFEKELAENHLLQQRLHLYSQDADTLAQATQNKSHEDPLKQTFATTQAQHNKKSPPIAPIRKINIWFYGAAAAVLFAIVLTYTLYNKSRNSVNLYAQYAGFPALSVARGGSDSNFAIVAGLYNSKRFDEAAKAFTRMAAKDTTNNDIKMDLYLSYLQGNRTKDALQGFNTIASYENVYTNQARWFAALTYLKRNDRRNCKRMLLLIPADSDTYAKAQQLLSDLQ